MSVPSYSHLTEQDSKVLVHLVLVNGPLTVAAIQGRLGASSQGRGSIQASLIRLSNAGLAAYSAPPRGSGSEGTYTCTRRVAALKWLEQAYPASLPSSLR